MTKKHSENILYVIPSLSFGGAEHETIDQLNYLHKVGQKVYLVVLSDRLELIKKLQLPTENIKVFNLKGFTTTRAKNFTKLPKAIYGVEKIIKENNIKKVIAVLPLSHLIVRLHKFFNRSNYRLWCFHKSMQYEATPINTFSKKVMHFFNKMLSKKYDYGHIFISEAVKKNISTFLKIKNGHVLHNAVHFKEETLDTAQKYLKENLIEVPEFLVVVPGRLHNTKGHTFFIDSLNEYIKSLSPKKMKVVFVGGGPLKEEIENKVAEFKLKEYVFITDFVDNSLMLSFLNLANLVVIPSIYEGFGNVAIEALMQGSTILASDTGGLPEIITDGKNGYLFKTLNKEELSKKFISLHQEDKKLNPKLLKQIFKERFTIEAQMDNLIKVIS